MKAPTPLPTIDPALLLDKDRPRHLDDNGPRRIANLDEVRQADARRLGQSRLGSLIESSIHTAIALVVGLVAQLVVFPAVGVRAEIDQNLAILAAFTVISFARTYVVRRLCNGPLHRLAMRLATWIKS